MVSCFGLIVANLLIPPQIDTELETGEYFLKETDKRRRKRKEQAEAHAEKQVCSGSSVSTFRAFTFLAIGRDKLHVRCFHEISILTGRTRGKTE